jgi:hypothetical protein
MESGSNSLALALSLSLAICGGFSTYNNYDTRYLPLAKKIDFVINDLLPVR